MTEEVLTEYDSIFCANPTCVLHVRPGDGKVQGSGNWAQLADGIIVGRRRVDAVMLCDRCAARVMKGEVILVRRNTVSAA
jgi:hypothetical protein